MILFRFFCTIPLPEDALEAGDPDLDRDLDLDRERDSPDPDLDLDRDLDLAGEPDRDRAGEAEPLLEPEPERLDPLRLLTGEPEPLR